MKYWYVFVVMTLNLTSVHIYLYKLFLLGLDVASPGLRPLPPVPSAVHCGSKKKCLVLSETIEATHGLV